MAIKAIVQRVILEGKHGPFFVATSDQISDGSITCSLEPTIWKGKTYPEEGEIVFLDELRKKRAGWRAKEGRFWNPSDEQNQQIERSRPMDFLYPTSRQYPFDEICEQIVRELEKRNWQVPGIKVDFYEYGTGEQKFRKVDYIRGKDFKLWFCRAQRTIAGGRLNDTAAVSEIVIPKKELHVYKDESGPTFYLYVGDNWKRDHEKFMNNSKVNSRLNGKPKMYLQYSGAFYTDKGRYPVAWQYQRKPYLVHTNDLGREYDPEGDEPKFFHTVEVMEEFRRYLKEVILKSIVSQPIPLEKTDTFATSSPIPFPKSIGPLFCFGDDCDAERITQGKIDMEKLDLSDRYGLLGSGYRLVPLGTPNDGTVPEISYEGFLWCGIGEVTTETNIDSLEISGHDRRSGRERFVIRIKPIRANDVYIADHAAYQRRRKELASKLGKNSDFFTNEEIGDFTRARARTIVPINEYHGGYEQPVVLIKRELSFDEVEIVSGPHRNRFGR